MAMPPKPERIPIEVFDAIWEIIKDMPPNKITQGGVAAYLTLEDTAMGIRVLQLKAPEFAYIVFLMKPPGEEFSIHG